MSLSASRRSSPRAQALVDHRNRAANIGVVDVEKTIEFLLSNQAKHDERLSRLETVVGSLANSVEKMADNVIRLDDAMVALAEAGLEADKRIAQMGHRVDQLVSAMGVMIRQQPPVQ